MAIQLSRSELIKIASELPAQPICGRTYKVAVLRSDVSVFEKANSKLPKQIMDELTFIWSDRKEDWVLEINK
jgi:hypothetical protein